jgi:hypothetical protein
MVSISARNKSFWIHLIVLLLVTSIFAPIPKAKAAFSGCPETWNLPKNLMEASAEDLKKFYEPNFETVLRPSQDTQYSFNNIQWFTVKSGWVNLVKPEQVNQQYFDASLLFSFFSSRWEDVTLIRLGDLEWLSQSRIFIRNTVSVVKQGCGNPTEFYFEKSFTPPQIETLNFETEIAKFKDKFINFEKYDSALQNYSKCLQNWKSYSGKNLSKMPLDTCYVGSTVKPGYGYPVTIQLIPDKSKCLDFLPGNANRATTVGVKPGTNCSFTILGFWGDNLLGSQNSADYAQVPIFFNGSTNKYVSFGKISIAARALASTTITCIKGKTIKKITEVNPKCPAGFKKK